MPSFEIPTAETTSLNRGTQSASVDTGGSGEKTNIKMAIKLVATNAPRNPYVHPDGRCVKNETIHPAPVTTMPPRNSASTAVKRREKRSNPPARPRSHQPRKPACQPREYRLAGW